MLLLSASSGVALTIPMARMYTGCPAPAVEPMLRDPMLLLPASSPTGMYTLHSPAGSR